MVAELISLHIFPQLGGRISDTPVRKDIMWKILGFVGEKKSANQIFRSISLSAAWMLSPISSKLRWRESESMDTICPHGKHILQGFKKVHLIKSKVHPIHLRCPISWLKKVHS